MLLQNAYKSIIVHWQLSESVKYSLLDPNGYIPLHSIIALHHQHHDQGLLP